MCKLSCSADLLETARCWKHVFPFLTLHLQMNSLGMARIPSIAHTVSQNQMTYFITRSLQSLPRHNQIAGHFIELCQIAGFRKTWPKQKSKHPSATFWGVRTGYLRVVHSINTLKQKLLLLPCSEPNLYTWFWMGRLTFCVIVVKGKRIRGRFQFENLHPSSESMGPQLRHQLQPHNSTFS